MGSRFTRMGDRFASAFAHCFLSVMALGSFAMAWGRWQGFIPAPDPSTWRDSPLTLLAAGSVFFGFEVLNCKVERTWINSRVGQCFHWLFPTVGLMAFVMAWGRWTGWLRPPRIPTWQDSPIALVGAGLFCFTIEVLRRWLTSFEFPEPTLKEREDALLAVQRLLKENVSAENSLRALLETDHWPPGESVESYLRYLLDWAAACEAELWYYNTDPDRWEHLCGECGFAIVQDGRVIAAETWMEN